MKKQLLAGMLLACVWLGCSLIYYGVPYGRLKGLLFFMVLAGISGCGGVLARYRRSMYFVVPYFACLLLMIPLDLLYDYHYADHVDYPDPEMYVFGGAVWLLLNGIGFVVGVAAGAVLFYTPPPADIPGEQ